MGQRPATVKPPAHWTKPDPAPAPAAPVENAKDPLGDDPTRFGDWTLKGIAVDF